MMTNTCRRTVATGILAAVLSTIGWVAGPPAALAQTDECDDPIYCDVEGEQVPPPPQECPTDAGEVRTGERANVTATNVARDVPIRFVLSGETVAEATGGDQASTSGEDGRFDVHASFVMPTLPPGEHELTAEGPGYAAFCTELSREGVLPGSTDRGTGGGSLARTGTTIALLVAVGVVLILAGRALMEAGRRRRRRKRRPHYLRHRESAEAAR